jgi:hypothetical protein
LECWNVGRVGKEDYRYSNVASDERKFLGMHLLSSKMQDASDA